MPRQQAADPVPGTYQHYKGAFYEVLGVAENPEDGKRYVVYRSLGLMASKSAADPAEHFTPAEGVTATATKGELAVCSVGRFVEAVDGKEYSGGKLVSRFRLVRPAAG